MLKDKRKRVIIIGAGENGEVALNCLRYRQDLEFMGFLDDAETGRDDVLGKISDWPKYADCLFYIAIGTNSVRKKIFQIFKKGNRDFINLIHPRSLVEKGVILGENVFIGANAYVNVGSKIGSGTIINNGCNVDHHNVIGDFCHLAPGVITGGGVKISDGVFVGLNSIIRDHIEIGRGSFIGMGSVIAKNVDANLLVYNRLKMVLKNSSHSLN